MQLPPGLGARSMTATRLPKYAACAPAFSPPGPQPMTIKSKLSLDANGTSQARTARQILKEEESHPWNSSNRGSDESTHRINLGGQKENPSDDLCLAEQGRTLLRRAGMLRPYELVGYWAMALAV